MFLSEGFDAVTMEAIANAVPLSKTTLYSRFASKEILLEAVVSDQISQWAAYSTSLEPALPNDLRGRLRIHIRGMARSMRLREVQGFMKLSFVLTDRFPALSHLMHTQGYLNHIAFMKKEIEDAAERDRVPVRDAGAVARHMVNSMAGWSIQEAPRGPTEDEALKAADEIVDLFMASRPAW
jgi:AcrR family transcriptional regulator